MPKKKRPVPSPEAIQPYLTEAPVRIMDLIRDSGIGLRITEMEAGLSSSVEANPDRFEITLNGSLGEVQQRFAAAYELSRLLLTPYKVIDHEGPVLSRLYGPEGSTTDQDAARLAAGLLLPAAGVREMHLSGKRPEEIGAAYKATGAAVRIRMRGLSITPHPDPVATEPVPEP